MDPAELALKVNQGPSPLGDPVGNFQQGQQLAMNYAQQKLNYQIAQQKMVQDQTAYQQAIDDHQLGILEKVFSDKTSPAARGALSKIYAAQAVKYGRSQDADQVKGSIDLALKNDDTRKKIVNSFSQPYQIDDEGKPVLDEKGQLVPNSNYDSRYKFLSVFNQSSEADVLNMLDKVVQGDTAANLAGVKAGYQVNLEDTKEIGRNFYDVQRRRKFVSPDKQPLFDAATQLYSESQNPEVKRAAVTQMLNLAGTEESQHVVTDDARKDKALAIRAKYATDVVQLRKAQLDNMSDYRSKLLATKAFNQVDGYTKDLRATQNRLSLDLNGLLAPKFNSDGTPKPVLKRDIYEANLTLAKALTGSGVVPLAREHGINFESVSTSVGDWLDRYIGQKEENGVVTPDEVKVIRDRVGRVYGKVLDQMKSLGSTLVDERVASGAIDPDIAERYKVINSWPAASPTNYGKSAPPKVDVKSERVKAQNALNAIQAGKLKGVTPNDVKVKFKQKTGQDF